LDCDGKTSLLLHAAPVSVSDQWIAIDLFLLCSQGGAVPPAPRDVEELAGSVLLPDTWFMLLDERTSPEQFEAFRRMPPGRRLALAEQLYWSARELKAAWLRAQHSDWSEEQVAREVTRIFSHARS
jgi:hypothetical protein